MFIYVYIFIQYTLVHLISLKFCLHAAFLIWFKAKVLAEQKEIFQNDYKRSAKFEDLRKMKYLKMTIMESLRIYTTVPMYARAIDKDIDWSNILK